MLLSKKKLRCIIYILNYVILNYITNVDSHSHNSQNNNHNHNQNKNKQFSSHFDNYDEQEEEETNDSIFDSSEFMDYEDDIMTEYKQTKFNHEKETNGNLTNRPNIILIITDDQDIELGSMNYMPKTLKEFREKGVEFKHGYVSTPMCCPSRSSLATGMYVHNHQVFTNNDNCSSIYWRKNFEKKTFGYFLWSYGYHTSYLGKYLNKYDGNYVPFGWSEWNALVMNSRFYNYTVNRNGKKHRYGNNYSTDYYPDIITRDALNFLRRMATKDTTKEPFLLVISYPGPHGPEDAAPQYSEMFFNETSHHTPNYNYAPNEDKQWLLRVTGKMTPILKDYTNLLMTKRLQTLQSIDHSVEKIFNLLRSSNLIDNTFTFYTSDHGYHIGQFGLVKGKSMPFEFDIRVPYFVVPPKKFNEYSLEGVEINEPVLNIDLAPTFLQLAGIDIPEEIDGRSLVPLLKSYKKSLRDNRDYLRWRDNFLIESSRQRDPVQKSTKSGSKVLKNPKKSEINSKQLLKGNETVRSQLICSLHPYPCLKGQKKYCLQLQGKENSAALENLSSSSSNSNLFPSVNENQKIRFRKCQPLDYDDDEFEMLNDEESLNNNNNKKCHCNNNKQHSRPKRNPFPAAATSWDEDEGFNFNFQIWGGLPTSKINKKEKMHHMRNQRKKEAKKAAAAAAVKEAEAAKNNKNVSQENIEEDQVVKNDNREAEDEEESLFSEISRRENTQKIEEKISLGPIENNKMDVKSMRLDSSSSTEKIRKKHHRRKKKNQVRSFFISSWKNSNDFEHYEIDNNFNVNENGRSLNNHNNKNANYTIYDRDFKETEGKEKEKENDSECNCSRGRMKNKSKSEREERKRRKFLNVFRKKQRFLHKFEDEETRNNFETCGSKEKMNCFWHDNDHWKTKPYWRGGAFCFCMNAINNSYSCIRSINSTHNYLYCEFITGFKMYFDIAKDPYQLQNTIESLPKETENWILGALNNLKICKGAKQCSTSTPSTSSSAAEHLNKIKSNKEKDKSGNKHRSEQAQSEFQNRKRKGKLIERYSIWTNIFGH